MASNSAQIGDLNEMVLRDGTSYPSDGGSDPPVELEFELLQPPQSGEQNEHTRQPRQLETAAALSAVEAFEILASTLATEAAPVVIHEAAVEGAAALEAAVPEAMPATGLIKHGELAAAMVPASAVTLAIPPIAVNIAPGAPAANAPAPIPVDDTVAQDEEAAPRAAANQQEPPAPARRRRQHGTTAQAEDFLPPTQVVRFGDHTIETTNVADQPIYSLKSPASSAPDFIALGGPIVANSPDNFTVVEHVFRVTSAISPVSTANALNPAINQHCDVFRSFDGPIAEANRHTCTVEWLSAIKKGYVAETDLAPFMNGNAIASRYVSSMLQPVLKPVSTYWLNAVTGLLRDKLIFHDNRAVYAKLICAALTQEICDAIGVQHTAEAWPGSNAVSYINLDDPNLTVEALQKVVTRGDLIFIENEDWDSTELLVTHWLADAGFRVDGADGHTTAQACYITWPAIPVCILRHGNALNRPAAAQPSPEALFQFALALADRRRERDALLAGIYIAMELVGVQYHQVGQTWYPCTSNFNTAKVQLPAPHDYNFMLRIAKIFPVQDTRMLAEAEGYSDIGAVNRVRLAALYNASLSAMTTTLLFSLSLTCQDVINWCTNANSRTFASTVLRGGITAPRGGNIVEAAPYFVPKLAIKHYLGLTPLINLFPGATWNGTAGATADAANAYHDMHVTHAPRFGTVLAIDNFLLMRPQEWCVLGPHTKIDITTELRANVGTALSRGVFSYRGAKEYMERAVGACPYLFVPYGVQLINAIHQYQEMGQAALHFNSVAWSYRVQSEFTLAQPAQDVSYNADLHIIEPCTYASFTFADSEVIAPCMAGNDLNDRDRRRLASWRGDLVDYVGFSLFLMDRTAFGPLEPPPIEGMAALGMFGGGEDAADAAASAQPALN